MVGRCCHPRPYARSVNIAAFGFKCTLPITSAMKAKNYVIRPWTEEEEKDFQRFCESIGQIPEDPAHAEAMEDGEVDFFNNDVFVGVKLYRA